MNCLISPRNLDLGVVNSTMAIIRGISMPSTSTAKLDALCEEATSLALSYEDGYLRQHPILEGFWSIYRQLGYSRDEVKPAALGLIELIRKRGRFPRINPAVDAYNTVVVKALLGIGAHDLHAITPPIVFTTATGQESFTPLGRRSRVPVRTGDFIYRDEHRVLAHLAAADCDEAKIQATSSDLLMVIEGNFNVTLDYTQWAIEEACRNIVTFCGGTFSVSQPQLMAV